jgi:hypothetical protein
MTMWRPEPPRRIAPVGIDQKASALTTLPPLWLPSACQVVTLIESLTYCTWQSQSRALTPPEWRLRAVMFSDR